MSIDRVAILILLIIVFMCTVTFLLFGSDKKRALRHAWRIPEATLLMSSLLLGGMGGWAGMVFFRHKTRKWKFRLLVPAFAIIQCIFLAGILWASVYYPADADAQAAMQSDQRVTVSKTASGWLFDGPSETSALIFYPGAKVEETAYAPLLHRLAADTMDVFLIKMPFRLAFLDIGRGAEILRQTHYQQYYFGGHSLGGAMAAVCASDLETPPEGLLLLASYPTEELPEDTDVLLIYGSEDRIVNLQNVEKADAFVSGKYRKCRLEGGNHAQFGNYGKQKGDGEASISSEEQQEETLRLIRDVFWNA